MDARWSETPMDARLRGHDKQLGPAPAQAGGGHDGGAGMTTMEDRTLRLVVTPAEAGVHDVLPFPAPGRSHPAYAGLT